MAGGCAAGGGRPEVAGAGEAAGAPEGGGTVGAGQGGQRPLPTSGGDSEAVCQAAPNRCPACSPYTLSTLQRLALVPNTKH